MSQPGKNNLITDIAGIRIGHAHDVAAKTGTSVILCEAPSIGAVAVAGGGRSVVSVQADGDGLI